MAQLSAAECQTLYLTRTTAYTFSNPQSQIPASKTTNSVYSQDLSCRKICVSYNSTCRYADRFLKCCKAYTLRLSILNTQSYKNKQRENLNGKAFERLQN